MRLLRWRKSEEYITLPEQEQLFEQPSSLYGEVETRAPGIFGWQWRRRVAVLDLRGRLFVYKHYVEGIGAGIPYVGKMIPVDSATSVDVSLHEGTAHIHLRYSDNKHFFMRVDGPKARVWAARMFMWDAKLADISDFTSMREDDTAPLTARSQHGDIFEWNGVCAETSMCDMSTQTMVAASELRTYVVDEDLCGEHASVHFTDDDHEVTTGGAASANAKVELSSVTLNTCSLDTENANAVSDVESLELASDTRAFRISKPMAATELPNLLTPSFRVDVLGCAPSNAYPVLTRSPELNDGVCLPVAAEGNAAVSVAHMSKANIGQGTVSHPQERNAEIGSPQRPEPIASVTSSTALKHREATEVSQAFTQSEGVKRSLASKPDADFNLLAAPEPNTDFSSLFGSEPGLLSSKRSSDAVLEQALKPEVGHSLSHRSVLVTDVDLPSSPNSISHVCTSEVHLSQASVTHDDWSLLQLDISEPNTIIRSPRSKGSDALLGLSKEKSTADQNSPVPSQPDIHAGLSNSRDRVSSDQFSQASVTDVASYLPEVLQQNTNNNFFQVTVPKPHAHLSETSKPNTFIKPSPWFTDLDAVVEALKNSTADQSLSPPLQPVSDVKPNSVVGISDIQLPQASAAKIASNLPQFSEPSANGSFLEVTKPKLDVYLPETPTPGTVVRRPWATQPTEVNVHAEAQKSEAGCCLPQFPQPVSSARLPETAVSSNLPVCSERNSNESFIQVPKSKLDVRLSQAPKSNPAVWWPESSQISKLSSLAEALKKSVTVNVPRLSTPKCAVGLSKSSKLDSDADGCLIELSEPKSGFEFSLPSQQNITSSLPLTSNPNIDSNLSDNSNVDTVLLASSKPTIGSADFLGSSDSRPTAELLESSGSFHTADVLDMEASFDSSISAEDEYVSSEKESDWDCNRDGSERASRAPSNSSHTRKGPARVLSNTSNTHSARSTAVSLQQSQRTRFRRQLRELRRQMLEKSSSSSSHSEQFFIPPRHNYSSRYSYFHPYVPLEEECSSSVGLPPEIPTVRLAVASSSSSLMETQL